MTQNTMKRPTLATLKSFVRKNQGKLYIRTRSAFDGMTDGVEYEQAPTIRPVTAPTWSHATNDLGMAGVWLVGSSRDSIKAIEEQGFTGFHVYNCCGSFDLFTRAEG